MPKVPFRTPLRRFYADLPREQGTIRPKNYWRKLELATCEKTIPRILGLQDAGLLFSSLSLRSRTSSPAALRAMPKKGKRKRTEKMPAEPEKIKKSPAKEKDNGQSLSNSSKQCGICLSEV